MVRYPDTITLITPGTTSWIDGKATIGAATEETVQCEVQPDSSNYEETINGKAVVAKYKVFFKNIYTTTTTARTARYASKEYNIMKPYITQLDVQMKLG